ncbi:MAG: replicative DNA helicase [Planctomycetota bacterium]|nr:replicative DNA helicase [Planctomycetota bacterium]
MANAPRIQPAPDSQASSSEIFDRQLPVDLRAEQGVLGSILLKPDVIDDVIPILRAEDFFDNANRRLYENVSAMHDGGHKIDSTLLVDRLKKSGDFEAIGGAAYLGEIGQSVPNAAHAIYYANIVREKSTLRSLIDTSTGILQDAYEQSGDARELLNQAEQRIFSIVDRRGTGTVSPINDILHRAMDRMESRMSGEQVVGGVETHFSDYDNLTGGLHNSELNILAARPSMGKTALAMNIAENVAVLGQHPVLFISLEMSSMELADRLLCSAARVNSHRLRNGSISAEDRQRLVEKAGQISQTPLFVDDSPSRTVGEIAAAARRILRRHDNLGLIVIDYLQLIEPDNPRDPRQEQVARIARRLKGLARDLDVPVLCLAQLNRQAEDSRDHRPRLSHLRESGAIEQDADVVMFIHREEYFHRGEEQQQYAGQAELIISKQRNGPVGEIELVWEKTYTRFHDKAPARMEAFDNYNATDEEEF